MLSKEAGPICWHGMSCEFTLLDNVFWDYVAEHIFIPPFGILLIEGLPIGPIFKGQEEHVLIADSLRLLLVC